MISDLGGARTLDPMIKSHLLYQLSYQVIFSAIEFFFQTSVCFSIAVAKVGFIFNLTNFSATFFEKIIRTHIAQTV